MGPGHGSSLVRPRQQALSSCSSLQLHDAAELDPVKVNAKCLHEGNVNRKERVKFDSHARIHISQTGTPLRMWSKQFFQDGRHSVVAGARGHGHNRTGLPAPAWIRVAAVWRRSSPHPTPQTHSNRVELTNRQSITIMFVLIMFEAFESGRLVSCSKYACALRDSYRFKWSQGYN